MGIGGITPAMKRKRAAQTLLLSAATNKETAIWTQNQLVVRSSIRYDQENGGRICHLS